MHSFTVYLGLMSNWVDYPMILASVAFKVHTVILQDKKNKHWSPTIWNFPINLFKDGLESSINIMKSNSYIE